MQPQNDMLSADDVETMVHMYKLLDPTPKEFGSDGSCASLDTNVAGSDRSDLTVDRDDAGCVMATTDAATAAWYNQGSAQPFDEAVMMLDDEAASGAPPPRWVYGEIFSDIPQVQQWRVAEQAKADEAVRLQQTERRLISQLAQQVTRAAYSHLRAAGDDCKHSQMQAQMHAAQVLQYLLARFSSGAPHQECQEFLTLQPIEVLFPECHFSRQCQEFRDCDAVKDSLEKMTPADLSRAIAFSITIAIRIVIL